MIWVRAAGNTAKAAVVCDADHVGAKPLIPNISLGGPKRWWMLSLISESRSVTELVGSRIIGRTEQQPTRF